MATMDTAMAAAAKYSLLSLSILASIGSAYGETDLTVSPYISIEEIYSDNVEFDNFDQIESFVTRTNVGLNSKLSSQSLDWAINSSYSHLFYSENDIDDNGYETLSSSINFRPWNNGLSLTATGNISHQPRSIGGNFSSDLISGDTIKTENYGGGLSYNVENSDFLFAVSGNYSDVSSADNIGNSYGYTTGLNFQNGIDHRTVFWDLSANYSDRKNRGNSARSYQVEAKFGFITGWPINPFIRYHDEDYTGSVSSGNFNQGQSTGVGFRWQPSSRLMWDISYNTPEDKELSDDYVAIDLSWQPSTRTSLTANYNQRFFGDSYGLNFNHRTKRLTNTISYNEQIRAFERDRFESFIESTAYCGLDAVTIDDCVNNIEDLVDPENFFEVPVFGIRAVEDNQFSLFKTLAWTSTLALKRTTFNLSINGNEREDLNTGSTQETISSSINVTRRLNAKSNVTLAWRFTRNEYITINEEPTDNRIDYYKTYSADYARELGKTLSLNLNLRYLERTSAINSRMFDETRATLSVKKDF